MAILYLGSLLTRLLQRLSETEFCRNFDVYSEIMHAMWKPQKFKYIYLLATLYVFTLTIPSATAVYWAFGDQLLNHSNAFSLLPRSAWRDAAVVLMLIHQVCGYPTYQCLCYHSLNWISIVLASNFTVHYVRVCVYAIVLCVGESGGDA